MPEERIEIDLPNPKNQAADGSPLKRIGEEVTLKLGMKPTVFIKKLIVRSEYADPRQPGAGLRRAQPRVQLTDGTNPDSTTRALC